MSQQTSLDQYFKCKSSPALIGTGKSFSSPLESDKNKTTRKRQRNTYKTVPVRTEMINLCSDDEDENDDLSQKSNVSQSSNSSETTILYNLTPSTPTKASASKSFRSPNSVKFFSPTKKRAVFKGTPNRNLAKDLISQIQCDSVEDDNFAKACEGMDDKSIFLLTTINKYLKDNSLRRLLDMRSVELLESCFNIIKPGMRLVCRLYWRQPGWYRREKLLQITNDEREILGDFQFMEIINSLIGNGLLKPSANFGNNTMDFDDLVKVLKATEVKLICKYFKLKVSSKDDGTKELRRFSQQKSIGSYFAKAPSDNSKRVLNIMRSKAGTCYRLSDLARSTLDKLYTLMYLGINYEVIREKRLELMLINDKSKIETYPIDKDMKLDNASVVFRNEEEFARYWNAHVIYEEYLTKVDPSEKCGLVIKVYDLYKEISEEDMTRHKSLPTWLRRYTPPYLYVKILENGIQELKKNKAHHILAVDILTTLISQIAFRQHKKAEWYAEKALVLHKLMAKHDEAAKVLIEGLKSNLSEEAKDVMRPRANKLANQQNIQLDPELQASLIELATDHLILENSFHADHVRKQHMESTKQRGKRKFRVQTLNGLQFMDAEDYCVLDYTTPPLGEFTHGKHWEGRIITTIYYLLFWEIIYNKPRGALGIFLSYFQLDPLDMYDEGFYSNRKTLIDERLMKIEAMTTDEMIAIIKQKWDERPECELSGINRSVGWNNVRAVCACLGPRATAALCRRLATNYAHAHSGFPDLTLWNINTNKIKFVEVKTDTDKPSMKQLQWMRYLREHGIDTGFCYVGVASGRVRARASGPPALTVKSVADINDAIS